MHVEVHLCHTRENDVPQDRRRVYIVGYHRALQPCIPAGSLPPPPMPQVSLHAFLEKGLPLTTAAEWSPNQWNIIARKYIPALRQMGFFTKSEYLGKCASFDACRDPAKVFGSFLRVDDLLCTLTTKNRYIVVISGGEGEGEGRLVVNPRFSDASQGMRDFACRLWVPM